MYTKSRDKSFKNNLGLVYTRPKLFNSFLKTKLKVSWENFQSKFNRRVYEIYYNLPCAKKDILTNTVIKKHLLCSYTTCKQRKTIMHWSPFRFLFTDYRCPSTFKKKPYYYNYPSKEG